MSGPVWLVIIVLAAIMAGVLDYILSGGFSLIGIGAVVLAGVLGYIIRRAS
jgi:hypothetical protein